MTFTHKHVQTNGIHMHVVEAGSGFPVLLCHRFPELWYSWRHQLNALAKAGFRAIASDQRGYGETEAPPVLEAYTIHHLVGDLTGLLDALAIDKAVIVGHDWGGPGRVADGVASAAPSGWRRRTQHPVLPTVPHAPAGHDARRRRVRGQGELGVRS